MGEWRYISIDFNMGIRVLILKMQHYAKWTAHNNATHG
jgi:hypothetical protein